MPREGLYLAQTPQAFERSLLCRAYAQRSQVAGRVTDDCQLVEALGHRCAVVPGSPLNIKITTPLDLKLAAAILPLLGKAQARELGSPVPGRAGDVGRAAQAEAFGSVRLVIVAFHFGSSSIDQSVGSMASAQRR